jgi:hypothetical protein
MMRLCLLALALSAIHAGQALTLEIRVFRASDDVTAQARVAVHRAGERGQPIGHLSGSRPTITVPAGIYDAQAVQEHDSRVMNIRWAERLVVMPYPDEDGHHLEVINLIPGYGALQIRTASGTSPIDTVALFVTKQRDHAVPPAPGGANYLLYVVRAGLYDVRVKRGSRADWHSNVEVPVDRTRLWVVP